MKLRIALLALVACSSLLPSCVTPEEPKRGPRSELSQKSWNRPERWEGQGAFGGMLQQR